MKERPVLFSAPMVRALLEGRKTQTRRLVKPMSALGLRLYAPRTAEIIGAGGDGLALHCPYGEPGDRLWVRETWAPFDSLAISRRDRDRMFYRADDEQRYETDGVWRPSIHMPRWASRITLHVTSVRVERLQAITEEDAIAEGFDPTPFEPDFDAPWLPKTPAAARMSFLWNVINGERAAWASNPWVWVVGFAQEEQR
jgi:hypothetical protein